MAHDFPEWIRRARARFPRGRLWPVDDALPQAILERLAVLAEPRRFGQVPADQCPETGPEASEQ